MIVQVANDLGLDRLFTYEVPQALEGKLAIGQLLSVPFGHRAARGFAMAIQAEAPVSLDYTLKPITGIVDETPFFRASLLTLVRQIAAYTAAPIERVLQTALPAAVLKPTMHAKEQLFVEAVGSPRGVASCDDASLRAPQVRGNPLTAKQQWLYEQIVRLNGGWLQQLCRELKTTPATLRAMAEKGVLTIEARQRRRDPFANRRVLPSKPLPLNEEQRQALAAIQNLGGGQPGVLLLQGVTGSGKTEVYLQAIATELAAGRGAIVMVPEIALTPQTVQRFAARFGESVAVLHSALSEGERYDEWHRIRSGAARVVIGPRSAVFAPVENLGLIVVDEEHETSYKQEESPRYHARDVAVMRGAIEGAKVVLGSATPSLESWLNVQKGKYACATMTRRAGAGTLPQVQIVDMTAAGPVDVRAPHGAIYSQELLEAIQARLERAEQTILFLNRRGYSRSVTCGPCGHVLTCPNCDLPYTYHQADACCRCHICGGWIPLPKVCPQCQSMALTYQGIGTQRAEAALKKCFPQARVLRMDADSTSRKYSHDDILGAFRRHEADILLGTQMIAKGLDFPNVTLVGVLNADSSLNRPDFRAGERTYQLLSQVAGRAGRAELPGEVMIQTYDPTSSVIRAAARGDFATFAREELKGRAELSLPPYTHLSTLTFKSVNLNLVSRWAQLYSESLQKVKGLLVGEALPCVLEKAEGVYRWQVVVRSKSVALLIKSWRWILDARPLPKEVQVALDVDALNMI